MTEFWQSSGKTNWGTPPEYLARLARLDRIAYDPCGSRTAVLVADHVSYLPDEDGLKTDWLKISKGGLVFSNPPFGEEIPPWIRAYEYWGVRGAEIVALLPAYTGAPWFQPVWRAATALHWWVGRMPFLDEHGIPQSGTPMYTVSAYFGRRPDAFADAFADAGPTSMIDGNVRWPR